MNKIKYCYSFFIFFSVTFLMSFPCCAENEQRVLYVNNLLGNDSFDGLSEKVTGNGRNGPLATIGKAFDIAQASDCIEIANTGRVYAGGNYLKKAGGTPEKPLVVDGHGAVISGLVIIPHEKWQNVKEDIIETDFCPSSNMLRSDSRYTTWPGAPQIWWMDGKTAPNCTSMDELLKTKGGFYWNKAEKKVLVHLPDGKNKEDVKIELPFYDTAIVIYTDYVVVKNLEAVLLKDDGFDTQGAGKNIVFKNCKSVGICDQGFSCHYTSTVTFEDCVARRCSGSGSCDVNYCTTIYRKCVFAGNTFEFGVYASEYSQHLYESCLIIMNEPFEQIWQRGNSSMIFINCVIIGKKGNSQNILKMQNGKVVFMQCTILDASSLAVIPANSTGKLEISNCIVGRMEKPFLSIPGGTSPGCISLEYNVYFGTPGIDFSGILYKEKNWMEFESKGRDRFSKWLDPELEGNLKALIPGDSQLRTAGKIYGSARCIGAVLPESVWKLYYDSLDEYETPEGLRKGKFEK